MWVVGLKQVQQGLVALVVLQDCCLYLQKELLV
jgi:hypothetical protein